MKKPAILPTHTHRNILSLGYTSAGMKGLEAVEQTQGNEVRRWYQVVLNGMEVLQTISLADATAKYDSLA